MSVTAALICYGKGVQESPAVREAPSKSEARFWLGGAGCTTILRSK